MLLYLTDDFSLFLKRAYVILKPDLVFPLSYYLIPFTGVLGMIIIVMSVILVSMHGSFFEIDLDLHFET